MKLYIQTWAYNFIIKESPVTQHYLIGEKKGAFFLYCILGPRFSDSSKSQKLFNSYSIKVEIKIMHNVAINSIKTDKFNGKVVKEVISLVHSKKNSFASQVLLLEFCNILLLKLLLKTAEISISNIDCLIDCLTLFVCFDVRMVVYLPSWYFSRSLKCLVASPNIQSNVNTLQNMS